MAGHVSGTVGRAIEHGAVLYTAAADKPWGQTVAYVRDPNGILRVGAVLEASGAHPGRSARDHLRVLSTAAKLPHEAAERVLDETGLAADANRRAGEYSLGIRQRLGLAAALLGDPAEVGELAAAHGVVLHGLVATSNLEHACFRLIHTAGNADRPSSTRETVP